MRKNFKGKMNEKDLLEYRKKVDEIDAKIGKLIKERVEIVKDVGKLKVYLNLPVKDEERIEKVYKNLAENSGLCIEDAKKIYCALIKYCLDIEEEIKNNAKSKTKSE